MRNLKFERKLTCNKILKLFIIYTINNLMNQLLLPFNYYSIKL